MRWLVCALMAALLTFTAGCGNDGGGSDEGPLADEQRICERVGRERGLGTPTSFGPTTAGEIVRRAKLLESEIPEVWRDADPGHPVAMCSFAGDSGDERTVRCSDGDLYSTSEPTQLLADSQGRVTDDVLGELAEPGPCPDGKSGVPE